MRGRWVVALALVASGCGRFGFAEPDAASIGDGRHDAPGGGAAGDAAPGTAVTFGERTGSQHTGVTSDTALSSSSPTFNYGAEDSESVAPTRTALLRFDVSALAPGTTVLAAQVVLTTDDGALASGQAEIYQVLEAWTEGTSMGGAGVANYTQRTSSQAWTNAGAGAPTSRSATLLASFTPSATSTDYMVDLNAAGIAAVQQWVNTPASNFGLAFTVSAGGGSWNFRSREQLTGASRPMLVVTVP